MTTKMNIVCRWIMLPLFVLILSAFSAEAYTGSGTYTYTGGLLTMNWTNGDFICDGPNIGTSTENVTLLSVTMMDWVSNGTQSTTMTWTRASGTAGDITGTWTTTNPTSGNSFTATFAANGTLSVVGTITSCSVNGAPFVNQISPTSAAQGSLVTINGTNFSPLATDNTVKFNGFPVEVVGVRPNQLFVLVPLVGATSGTFTVTNSGGQASSATPFTVTNGTTAATLSWGSVHHLSLIHISEPTRPY